MSEMMIRYPINLSLHTVDDAALIEHIEALARRKMLSSTICRLLAEQIPTNKKMVQEQPEAPSAPQAGQEPKTKVKFIDDD